MALILPLDTHLVSSAGADTSHVTVVRTRRDTHDYLEIPSMGLGFQAQGLYTETLRERVAQILGCPVYKLMLTFEESG